MTTETRGRETGPDLTRSLIASAMREVGFTAPEATAGQLFVTDAGKELRRLVEAGYKALCCCLGGSAKCEHHR